MTPPTVTIVKHQCDRAWFAKSVVLGCLAFTLFINREVLWSASGPDPIPALVSGSPSPSITPSGPTPTPGPLLVVVATEPPTPTPIPTATKTPPTYCAKGLPPKTICEWPPKVEVTTPIPVSTCTATAYPGLTCLWTEGA